jgi:hypothetical protein
MKGVDNMAEFASKGVAGSGLGLGIAGTALGLLNGGLGNILGTGCNHVCSENMAVTRYELGQEQKIAQLESQIALRDANIYSDQKLVEVYKDLSARINGLEAGLNAQAVYNATNTATINCIQGQVAQLFGLTKLVVPNTSVCPGWGNVTITPSTTIGA